MASAGARHIHLDRPTALDRVAHWEVFEGWAVAPEAETLSIRLDGAPLAHHGIRRPDVEAAYPGLVAHGFIFFMEPTRERSSLDIRIGSHARSFAVSTAPDAAAARTAAEAARAKHRQFLQQALVCPSCRRAVRSMEGEWSCECGERFDCRGAVNLIPLAYPDRSDIRFSGAICSHGYDQSVEALIGEASASGGMVLDCGAGWRSSVRDNVITTEILQYPSTDVVAVGERLPFCDRAFDGVLSLHVLEHVKNPFVCAAELMRVLKPGGRFIAVTPYIVQGHGFPFHFFNPTPDGLRALFADFAMDCTVTVPRIAHPIVALRELVSAYRPHLEPSALSAFRDMTLGDLMDADSERLLGGRLVDGFKPSGIEVLAGNYAISGVRRP